MLTKRQLAQAAEALNDEERQFLREGEKRYRANVSWFAFEDWAFSMRSPVFSRNRSHRNVLTNPLYIALREMWLDLGVKQGMVAPSKSKEKDRARRKTQRSRPAAQERNGAKKRDVAAADSPAHRRVSKSRT